MPWWHETSSTYKYTKRKDILTPLAKRSLYISMYMEWTYKSVSGIGFLVP